MSQHFGVLKKIINDSGLEPAMRRGLIDFFSKARDSELEPITILCFNDPEWIHRISENYREKLEALETDNVEMWEHIIYKEAWQLGAMST